MNKHHHLLIIAILLSVLCPTVLWAQQPKYRLAWEDHFNGTTFDSLSWTKTPRGKSDWNRHMSSEDSLYAVSDGHLILRGVVNRTVASDTARYITGGLYTKGKRHIGFGKVEVRARLGCAQGAWPAIWMLPEDAAWPNGGEIDIMEHLNYDSIVYQTVHSYYTYVLKLDTVPPHSQIMPIRAGEYNTYTVEILPDRLVYSVNGQQSLVYPRIETDKEGQYPFGTPFYLLIDMQIEGVWVGKARPEEYPVEMEVDWVKMYDLVE